MNVLVTGGAGYIGSHAVRALLTAGHQVTVLDDLSNGHAEAVHRDAQLIVANVADSARVAQTLREFQVEAVMHFAAFIEVGESVSDPQKYYANNFTNALSLLQAMREAQVQKFVFSSTAAVYGVPERTPIDETEVRRPINPYGRSKFMVELALEDFSKAYGLGYTILRYFNVAGADPDGTIGEDHHPESHLIPRILSVARGAEREVKIFGTDYPTADGTCVRDYVHVYDLARAHVLALEKTEPGRGDVYNLGSENGFSVREVIAACEKVIGRQLHIKEEARRAGDPPVLIASSRKIRDRLNWVPKFPSMEDIVAHAWTWHTRHPEGFKTAQKDSIINRDL